MLVQLVVVALRLGLALLGGLLGLLSRGSISLLLGAVVGSLALLANVGLFSSLESLGLALGIGNDVLVVQPELVGQPDGQGGGLGALDVDALDVAPLLGHPLVDNGGGDGLDVGSQLLGGPVGEAHADGGVCGGGEADEGRRQGLFNLLGDISGGAGVDLAVLLLGLGLLAVDLAGLWLEDDGDGALEGGLVKGLAEDLGQAVDDAVVAEEDVVLGEELALGLVLAVLCLELGDVDDAGHLLAQLGGEVVRGDNVLVGALGVGGDEADGGLGRGVEAVRQRDLAGLQASLVGNVSLGGEREPDGLFRIDVVFEDVALV